MASHDLTATEQQTLAQKTIDAKALAYCKFTSPTFPQPRVLQSLTHRHRPIFQLPRRLHRPPRLGRIRLRRQRGERQLSRRHVCGAMCAGKSRCMLSSLSSFSFSREAFFRMVDWWALQTSGKEARERQIRALGVASDVSPPGDFSSFYA